MGPSGTGSFVGDRQVHFKGHGVFGIGAGDRGRYAHCVSDVRSFIVLVRSLSDAIDPQD